MTNSEDTNTGDNLSTLNPTSKVTDTFSSSSGSEHVNQLCSGSRPNETSCSVEENVNVNGSSEPGGRDTWTASTSEVGGDIPFLSHHRNEDLTVPSSSSRTSSCPASQDGHLQLDTTLQASNLQPTVPTLPFKLICGENLEYKCDTTEGVLALTNYRLFIKGKNTNFNIPIGVIEQVENRDIFFLHVSGKDARCIRCTFPNNETATETMKKIQTAISSLKKIDDTFAYTFHKNSKEDSAEEIKTQLGVELPKFPTPEERFNMEIKRMEFNTEGPWRISNENHDYSLCGSYPTHIIVPINMHKKKLEQVACFRSAKRFPAVVWRHRGNGAVISRCSQPEVGWFGWRSADDEELVENIVMACADNSKMTTHGGTDSSSPKPERIKIDSDIRDESSSSDSHTGSLMSMEVVPAPPNVKKLLILDARSYTTAVANRARGGGCECLEYYPRCEIQFMNLANIHSIRKSFMNVRQLCTMAPDQSNSWYSQLESCKWLQHMSGLMKAAITVVTAIEEEGRPVMVHCSDGWDRTPQIVALAEILLDPYYRSLEGFQVLVEREWLDFGHKFADRCGQPLGSEDANERCPVFLQWLDCLHQLIRQFPTAFEFNLTFLVKLAQHTYSNLFGTFLCNTVKERRQFGVEALTHSVWRFLRAPVNASKFRNNLYLNCDKVLWPSCEVRELVLWTQVYLGYENPPSQTTEILNPSQESSPAPSVAADCERSDRMAACKSLNKSKTRSCEDLHSPFQGRLKRRQSDPNLSDSFHAGDAGDDTESDDGAPLRASTPVKEVPEQLLDTSDVQNSSGYTADDSSTGIGRMTDFDDSDNDDTEPNSESRSESTVVSLSKIDPKAIDSSTDTLIAADMVAGCQGDDRLLSTDVKGPRESYRVTQGRSGKTEFVHTSVASGHSSTVSNAQSYQMRRKMEAVAEGSLMSSCHIPPPEDPSRVKVEGMGTCVEPPMNEEGVCDPSSTLPVVPVHCEVCAISRKILKDMETSTSVHGEILNPASNNNFMSSSTTSTQVNPSNGISIAGNGNKLSSYNTPMHSRTPSTGVAITPEENSGGLSQSRGDKQLQDVGLGASFSTVRSAAFDVDGLSSLHDEVQMRLNTIVFGYKSQIEILQRELQMTRTALMNQVCHKCTNHMGDRPDDVASVGDSLASGEHQSVGHESQSSEISWEAVDERDTRPPLWVPDYAVTHCLGCEASFWLGKRKHHCRSCGKVFCADCSDQTITIPSEQIFTPVRVCGICFQRLASHSSENVPGPNGSRLVNGMHGLHEEPPSAPRHQNSHGGAIHYANHHQNGCDHSKSSSSGCSPPKSSSAGQTAGFNSNLPSSKDFNHSNKKSNGHESNGVLSSGNCVETSSARNLIASSSPQCYSNHAKISPDSSSNLDTSPFY